jgi:hypothetical protein
MFHTKIDFTTCAELTRASDNYRTKVLPPRPMGGDDELGMLILEEFDDYCLITLLATEPEIAAAYYEAQEQSRWSDDT